MKWAPADTAQLAYLRAQGAGYDAIAAALSRTRYQVKAKVEAMIRAHVLARRQAAHRIAQGRAEVFAMELGIPVSNLPDYRLMRRKGYVRDEAVETIRRWVA